MEVIMNNKKKIDDNQKVAEIIVIKEFIEQKSKENYKGYYSDKNIQEAHETLKRYNKPSPDEFTFTVGDINAYLG